MTDSAAAALDVRDVLEGMSDAFFALDRGWHLVYINSAAERAWRRRRNEIVGLPLLDVFPQLRDSPLHATLQAALTDGKNHRGEAIEPILGAPVELNVVATRSGVSVYFRDISARRQMEGDVRERDELIAFAGRAAGIGVWDIDIATGMLRGTPQFFRIMGLEPTTEAVPLETTRRLRYPEDRERVMQGFDEAVANGMDDFRVEYRILRPDGETRWILGRGHVIRDSSGIAVRHSGVDVDITERKLAEAALRESEARFRRVFEQSPLGKAMAGPDFRFRSVNPALCAMVGYAAEELIGRSFLELVHPDDRDHCRAMGGTLVSGAAQQIQLEERFVRKSGESFWVNVNVGAIRDPDGKLLYSLGIIEDIDERKRMTQALQISEQRLRDLTEQLGLLAAQRATQLASSRALLQTFFDTSLDWLTLQRATPDGRMIYVDLNPACETAYGMSREQVIGRTVEEIIGTEAAQMPMHHLRECLRTGTPQRYVAHRTMASRTRTIDVMAVLVPAHAEDSDRFIITSARDITEREQLEAQLRQAQKMEAIGQLTGGVAHDFNNLLAVISGNAELARHRPAVALPRLLDNILSAAERGATLTRQLLSFSRRQSGKPQVFDLRAEMPRIAEMLRTSLRGNIEMRLAIAESVWLIEVDPAELEIALLNSAVNARDAMPNGGRFEIDIRNATQASDGAMLNGDHVAIIMRDTGSGIPPDIISKVFDPFFTTKEPGEGTGLGLSQVYGFAQQSGGNVTIESQQGRGTTLIINLPRSRNTLPITEQRVTAAAPDRISGHILLVEDNPQVAAVTAQMLGAMGFKVEVTDRARKALARLDADAARFALLLTDVVMPEGMNGFELANEARLRLPTLPIVIVSGYNDVVSTCGTRFPVLRKPVPYDELYRAICACLETTPTVALT